MNTKSCTCNGNNENCDRCGGRGYIEIKEPIFIKTTKEILLEYYNTYSNLKFEFVKELLTLENSLENELKFKEAIEFYINEKSNLHKFCKYIDLITKNHLLVPLCENYFEIYNQVKHIITKVEEEEINLLRINNQLQVIKPSLSEQKDIIRKALKNIKLYENVDEIKKKYKQELSNQSTKKGKKNKKEKIKKENILIKSKKENTVSKPKKVIPKKKYKELGLKLDIKSKNIEYLNIKDTSNVFDYSLAATLRDKQNNK